MLKRMWKGVSGYLTRLVSTCTEYSDGEEKWMDGCIVSKTCFNISQRALDFASSGLAFHLVFFLLAL